jgi:hypothetical protein
MEGEGGAVFVLCFSRSWKLKYMDFYDLKENFSDD